MKKSILILLILLCNIVKAQEGFAGKRAEKIQALKIAFITQKLELTPVEAQKFWPVYGQYENDLRRLLGDNRSADVLDNEERILNIRKKYRPEFERILGTPRMNKLFTAEKEFRGILLRQLKNRPSLQTNKPANQQRILRNR